MGELYKLQICCDAIQSQFQWYIQSIFVINAVTNEEYRYNMDNWLSNVQHTCQVIGELPVGFKKPIAAIPSGRIEATFY